MVAVIAASGTSLSVLARQHINAAKSNKQATFLEALEEQQAEDYGTIGANSTDITHKEAVNDDAERSISLINLSSLNQAAKNRTGGPTTKAQVFTNEVARILRNQIKFLTSFLDLLIEKEAYGLISFEPGKQEYAYRLAAHQIEYQQAGSETIYRLRYANSNKSLLEVKTDNRGNYTALLDTTANRSRFKTTFSGRLDQNQGAEIKVLDKQDSDSVFLEGVEAG